MFISTNSTLASESGELEDVEELVMMDVIVPCYNCVLHGMNPWAATTCHELMAKIIVKKPKWVPNRSFVTFAFRTYATADDT